MPFGSERHLLERRRFRAWFYRRYGVVSVGDKIRASYILPALQSWMDATPGAARVLDAGCGAGHYTIRLAQAQPHSTVTAVDVDTSRIAEIKEIAAKLALDNVEPRACSLLDLQEQAQYDLVLCVDVLEHVEQDDQVARRLSHALKPGGTLLLHVPQVGQRHVVGPEPEWTTYGHVREGYSPEALSSLLTGAGLEMVHHRHSFGPFGAVAADLDERSFHARRVWVLLLPVILALAWLDSRVTNRWGNGSFAVAHKPESTQPSGTGLI